MIEMVIIFSFKMMKSGVTSNEMIDIALRIKSRHRIAFLLYILVQFIPFIPFADVICDKRFLAKNRI